MRYKDRKRETVIKTAYTSIIRHNLMTPVSQYLALCIRDISL